MNRRLVSVSLARNTARVALLMIALCASGSTGCKKRAPAQPLPPGLLDENGQQRQAEQIKQPEPAQATETPEPPTVYDFERQQAAPDPAALSAKLPPSGLAPGKALDLIASEDAGAPARDLDAELSNALSTVSNCVDVVQAAARPDGRLTISVNAYVQGSGRVSRATVTAPGQPASALSCIEKLVLAVTLQAPVPSAPVQVKGTTQLQIRSAGGTRDAGLSRGDTTPIMPHPTNPDIARPEPGDVAGPP
jgi:hypothetical protein